MKSATDQTRRKFILAASLAGAGAAAALIAEGRLLPRTAAVKAPVPSAGQGYRDTEHVRRYYSTARI
ncbi:MAG TPA: hypothetical protein VF801_02920 [Rhodocyclaceae bacterium]